MLNKNSGLDFSKIAINCLVPTLGHERLICQGVEANLPQLHILEKHYVCSSPHL